MYINLAPAVEYKVYTTVVSHADQHSLVSKCKSCINTMNYSHGLVI